MKNINFELSKLNSVNHLWSDLIESFGFDKAKQILSQANDLQRMNGKKSITLPIVFSSTGGIGLLLINSLKRESYISCFNDNQVLIFNKKKKLFQILNNT